MTTPGWAAWIIAAAAVAGAALYLAKLGIAAFRKIIEAADVILGSKDHDPLSKRLDRIEHELYPNSGFSLRDTVDRTEQIAAQARFDAVALKQQMESNAQTGRRRRNEDRALLRAMNKRLDVLAEQVRDHTEGGQ